MVNSYDQSPYITHGGSTNQQSNNSSGGSSSNQSNNSNQVSTPSTPIDPLAGFVPRYDTGGHIVGFEKGNTFIPRETALTQSGSYQPQNATPIYTTNSSGQRTITGYSNASGIGNVQIVPSTNGTTYYNVTSGHGEVQNQYSLIQPVQNTISNQLAQQSSNLKTDYKDALGQPISVQKPIQSLSTNYSNKGGYLPSIFQTPTNNFSSYMYTSDQFIFKEKKDLSGRGGFTMAVDIGDNQMQDYTFNYNNGKIIRNYPIGTAMPIGSKDTYIKLEKYKSFDKKENMSFLPQNKTSISSSPVIDRTELNNKISNAFAAGDIVGFSGKVLTDTQMAKQNLLFNAGLIQNKVSQYGEYAKGTTPLGTSLLTQYSQSQPLSQQLPQGFEQVTPLPTQKSTINNIIDFGVPSLTFGSTNKLGNVEVPLLGIGGLSLTYSRKVSIPVTDKIVKGVSSSLYGATQLIDYPLNKLGVPEGFRTLSFGLNKNSIIGFNSGSPLYVEPTAVYNLHNEDYAKLDLNKKTYTYVKNNNQLELDRLSLGQATVIGGVIGTSAVTLSPTTTIALGLNYGSLKSLTEKPTSSNINEQKASVTNLLLVAGTEGIGSLAFGTGTKIIERGLETAGKYTLAKIAVSNVEGVAGRTALNVVGLGLRGGGYVAKYGTEIYFKTKFIGEGLGAIESFKQGNIAEGQLKTAGLGGGVIGYKSGEILGENIFSTGLKYSSKYIPVLSEEGKVIKKSASNIQFETLTEPNKKVVAYRYGYVETGAKFNPRYDAFNPKVENPTKQTFFRYEETTGVKDNEIQPVLSKPGFVQDVSYGQMYKSNLNKYQGEKGVGKYFKAFAETPISKSLSVTSVNTKDVGNIREKGIYELSTQGKLSKQSQREILNMDTLISDKMREFGATENELVLRESKTLANKREVFLSQDKNGDIVTIISEKGLLNQKQQSKNFKGNIIEQNAKYIQRNLGMQEQFKEGLVQPKEHAYVHAKNVALNTQAIIDAYPEYNKYFISKYGSLEKAKSEIFKGGLYHDIGKTDESSKEFGTPHGKKVADVIRKGLFKYPIKEGVTKAIETHETLNTKSIGYKIKDFFGKISPEQKILSTADRLDLPRQGRYNIKVEANRLPLSDVFERLGREKPKSNNLINEESPKEPYKFNKDIYKSVSKINPTVYSGTSYQSQVKSNNNYPIVKSNYKTVYSNTEYPKTNYQSKYSATNYVTNTYSTNYKNPNYPTNYPKSNYQNYLKTNYSVSKYNQSKYNTNRYNPTFTTGKVNTMNFQFGIKSKQGKLKKGISQPIAYEPSLGSSVFNIKLSNKGQLKSGKVSPFQRRGTLSLKQLRKINTGSSIF